MCEDVACGSDVAIGMVRCYGWFVIPAKVSRWGHLYLRGLHHGHWLMEKVLRLCLLENYL